MTQADTTAASMKKLINSPDTVLRDALEGTAAAHGDRVRVNFDPPYIVRADAPPRAARGRLLSPPLHIVRPAAPVGGRVAIVSGGGWGREPMHGGFVGNGM